MFQKFKPYENPISTAFSVPTRIVITIGIGVIHNGQSPLDFLIINSIQLVSIRHN